MGKPRTAPRRIGQDYCRLCGRVIDGGWTRNRGARVHWECAVDSGDPPDIIMGAGEYAPRYPCRACQSVIMTVPDTICGDCADYYNPGRNQ